MGKAARSIVAGLLASWPGAVLGVGTLVFRQEYFFLTYAIVSGVFWALSFGLGVRTVLRHAAGQSCGRTAWLAFRDLALAWVASLVLLGILNLTPLCVGQDNGDGRNNCTQCVIQTVGVAVVFTVPVLTLVGLAALGLGRWLSPGNTPPVVRGTNRSPKTWAGLSIAINFLVSWTLLPLVIPPFRDYALHELGEVLLWQGMGTVGWPLGLVGGVANLLLHRRMSDLTGLLLLSMYPVMLGLLLLSLWPKRPKWWALVALHLLLAGSFALVWYKVLNGYDFMKG